ncbi:MAG: DEAD/DEAH box helicase, partial [Acidimicrobiia bacterium]
LIHAPTGSGKTLAAFLWAIDRLLHEPTPPKAERCRVLYISPMKALAYDIDRNLRAPLVGIRHAAARLATEDLPEITTAMRTGDTPASERQRMQRIPPDILLTTPESLYLMLTSQARRMFGSVQWVIVDEVHAVAGTKRGAHLALSLERLEELTATRPQRIGLSATQRPIAEIARFLGGGAIEGDSWSERPVTVVDAPGERDLDIEIVVPVEDLAAPAPLDQLGAEPIEPEYRSIWPAVYPELLKLIEANTSTIVFANSRRLAERICSEINKLAGEEIARAHHGSVSREHRVAIEEALKRGELKAVVATSSLELGIDMGAVDLVVQVESPTSVASGLQRAGRSGHHVGGSSRARVFPKYRGDLLEATVVVDRMQHRLIEATSVPTNPLDVLAQQIVAATAMDDRPVEDLFRLVRQAAHYRSLGRNSFEAVLDMLSGRYPSDLFSELRPRITWDRVADSLTARPGAQQIAVQNPGTIPDRGYYPVSLPDGPKIGELDEEMVYESRIGDTFILGSSTWKIADITPDRVEVIPAPADPAPRMPFWHGDILGRPAETGRAVGEFLRHIDSLDRERAQDELAHRYRLDALAAKNLLAYLEEEKEAVGSIPTDRNIVVERFRDEIGDWRLVLLSPFGARVHAPWAMALTQQFRGRYSHDVNVIWADDGIAFRFADADDPPGADDLELDPTDVETLIMDHLADTALFQARFREAAARALLLPRRRPGRRTPLWLQRRRAADLQAVARQFGSFPIVLETFREILQDDFDLDSLRVVLTDIRSRKVRMSQVDTTSPSPFASSLLFDFVAAYLYEGDSPLAERRAAALSLDRELLRELLGEGELRELISPEVIESVEMELQRLTPDRYARTRDSLCDLLRDLGPLTTEEIAARSSLVEADLSGLEASHRIITVRIAGSLKWAAIEDASRLRDALGAQPPPGVPDAFLDPVPDPLGDVVGRYARTHGPFTVTQVAQALSLPSAVITTTLSKLEGEGRVTEGTFHATTQEVEWIDTDVLRRLKRRTLAALRKEIEPAEQSALGRFLPAWHGVGSQRSRTAAGLSEVIRQLQGASLPASIIERDILPTRLDFSADLLDHLMVTGEVVWVGQGSLGARDGRVALFFREQLGSLHVAASDEPTDEAVHDTIRTHLEAKGASFFRDLYEASGGGDPQLVLDALWDLVWAGEVTNDSFAPLRAHLLGKARRSGRALLSSSFPPSSAGRWSLVSHLMVSETERATALALQLLERHGLVTREVVRAEGTPGGFASLYPVLNRLEETGRARRGYFVEGLGGAQFALPGAVDRLRSDDETDGATVLAAADPANAYGAALAWPESAAEGRPARAAGAYVVLVGGSLVVFLERGGKRALTFTDDTGALRSAAGAMAEIATRNRRLRLETVDGQPASGSPLGLAMSELGFAPSYKGGLVLRST